MPPSAVKSIKDIIFWQYAKIIAESSHMGRRNYGFIMSKFKELQTGKIHWSSSIHEYVKEHENSGICIYCGAVTKLTLEHILPTKRGGPDIPVNAVMVCQSCNSSKGAKRFYEWDGPENIGQFVRIAESKYLKLLYHLHELRGTLDYSDVKELCKSCDMTNICTENKTVEKLSVFCIEGCFKKI